MVRCFGLAILVGACGGGGGGGGDDEPDVDAAVEADAAIPACALPETISDTTLPAFQALRCSVPGSSGAKKWYRLAAQLPGMEDFVQLELWPELGPYSNDVTTGTFTIAGEDLVYDTCGVCARGLGDRDQTWRKEYFATSGMVNVTSIGVGGETMSATLTNIALVEVLPSNQTPVANGCMATVTSLTISGTIMDIGGTGGGGGGGGGGAGGCSTGIAD